MKTFKINTICDSQGFKPVFTDLETNISKVWYFEFYDFNREIIQVSHCESYEIQADGFNHALLIYKTTFDNKRQKEDFKRILDRKLAYENAILRKFGKKLKGIKNQSKLNAFLR